MKQKKLFDNNNFTKITSWLKKNQNLLRIGLLAVTAMVLIFYPNPKMLIEQGADPKEFISHLTKIGAILFVVFLSSAVLIKNEMIRNILKYIYVAILVLFSIIFFSFVFIDIVGNLALYAQSKYDFGSDNWLSYFGAMIGTGVTIWGAYFVTVFQNNKNKKK